MNTYKNTEIADSFNVSNTTVIRWIEGSLKKKNNLQLFEVKGKLKIIKNDHNNAEMSRLSKQGVIYKNRILYSEVSPKPQFYELYNNQEIIEIINFLDTKRILPHKYDYKGDGARIWDKFVKDGTTTGNYSTTEEDVEALQEISAYLEFETEKYSKINIIDIGCGNSSPMIKTIEAYVKSGRINKYIAVDISREMLEIATRNIQNIFPDLEIEAYQCDIENENPTNIFFKSKINSRDVIANLLYCVGATYGNLNNRQKALANLSSAMSKDDYLIFTNGIDTIKSRSEFGHLKDAYDLLFLLPKLLNIDYANCEIVTRYNEQYKRKQIALRLDKDYSIDFELFGTTKRVDLFKGEEVAIFIYHGSTIEEIVKELNIANLKLQYLSVHETKDNISAIATANMNSLQMNEE